MKGIQVGKNIVDGEYLNQPVQPAVLASAVSPRVRLKLGEMGGQCVSLPG